MITSAPRRRELARGLALWAIGVRAAPPDAADSATSGPAPGRVDFLGLARFGAATFLDAPSVPALHLVTGPVASSKYIAYRTDADASVVCLDDHLEREDEFIERTASLLGVEPPSNLIDYVWDPVQNGSEPWSCPDTADCYQSRDSDNLSVVVSNDLMNHHELVHAIETQALGGNAHPTLVEGLAEYLGSLTSTYANDRFPEYFKAMLDEDAQPSSYPMAMHFVGSIFVRYGASKYLALRAKMPKNAGLKEFAAVFEAEFQQSLDAALVEMSHNPVSGAGTFFGCGEGEAREIDWSSEGLIDAVIESSCGDPWFFGGGSVKGRASFFGWYVIELPVPGTYELTVSDASASSELRGLVTGCSFTMLESAVISSGGRTSRKLLQAGRHTLAIAFPPQSEARGRAMVRLEYIAPP